MKKRVLSSIFAILLALTVTACSGVEALQSLAGNGNKWVDSDLTGSVSADEKIREQDDFAAAVNGPWKLETGDQHHGVLQDVTDAVLARKKQIVTDETIPGETAARLRAYYALASDWDARNADGITPLKPYIEDIESIESLDELYAFFADSDRNPLYLAPFITRMENVMHTGVYKEGYTVWFSAPELTLSVNGQNDFYFTMDSPDALEQLERVRDKAGYMLSQLGYSDKEASELISKCMTWEKEVAAADNMAGIKDPDDITYSRDEALALMKGFPFEIIINSWGFSDTKYFMINPAYAKKVGKLCQSRDLDHIKAWLIVNYALKCASFLDRGTYEQMQKYDASRQSVQKDIGITGEQAEDSLMFDEYIGMSPMVGAMNQIYVENFFDDSQIEDLTSITNDLLDGFREIFKEEAWLSDEGKKLCLEKLDALKVHIAYQNFDSVDYKNLKFSSREEGGNFMEAYFAGRRFEMDQIGKLSGEPYDASYWDPLNQSFSTTMTNAAYMPSTNGIYIFAGICEKPVYSPDMSYEEKLAGLFSIIGHEITHGFDKTGAQYDKDGLENTWLPYEDQMAFNDKNDAVGAYYTTLSPYPGSGLYQGTRVNGEATADMGGLRATLQLAEKDADFDYDLYFRSYANVWKVNMSQEAEKNYFQYDEHPLSFYRINVGLQQFDEFYETYGIKEGDGMYLAPEKRIRVW